MLEPISGRKLKGNIITPGRRQSETVLISDGHGSKIAINSVFDCHLSPIGRQMESETVSNGFYLRSSILLRFRLPPIMCESNYVNSLAATAQA